MTQAEREAVCRLTRTAAQLLAEVQTRNSSEWTLAQQLQRDLAVVEQALGGYCDDVSECDAQCDTQGDGAA